MDRLVGRRRMRPHRPTNFMIALLCAIAAFAAILLVLACRTRTPPIRGESGEVAGGSVASLETVTLGGVEQAILIRGRTAASPLLLYLHGGPGSPEMVPFRYYHSKLEDHFVVVNWDQRGAGKSYSSAAPVGDLRVQRILADTEELVRLLLRRFGQRKLVLVGHSWGTVLGLLTAHRCPELIRAYVGSGQQVKPAEAERLSFEYLKAEAVRRRNTRAARELSALDTPEPYPAIDPGGAWFDKLMVHRKWLVKMGGEFYRRQGYGLFLRPVLSASEYSPLDFAGFARGSSRSLRAMWPEILGIDFFKQVPKVEVPVFFLSGRHDRNTSAELVARYYDEIEAPRGKKLVWFENSAHSPMYEEPARFEAALLDVLDETSGG